MPNAFDNERVKKVIERFGYKVLGRTSICGEFEDLLKGIKHRMPTPSHCLEIGTFNGISTMILAQYFDSVTAITKEDAGADRSVKYKIWDYVGAKNIVCIDINSNHEKKAVVDKVAFDFAYLDGDHAHDTLTDFAMTKRCGRILFHEYWPLQLPVWNLVKSLPPEEVIIAQHDCLAYWEQPHG